MRMIRLSEYQKMFSLLYFPVWFLVSWAIYEALLPHRDYLQVRANATVGALVLSLAILAVTGIPSFKLLKKRGIGTKAKTLMAVTVILIALSLIPRAYSSHLNKMRIQEYVKDLKSHGLTVKYVDHLYYSWLGGVRRVDNYTEFVDIASHATVPYARAVTISGGVPYHFLFFFPRTIEMTCASDNLYIIRIG